MLDRNKAAIANEELLRQSFVEKCGKQEFGTMEQLRGGIIDHDTKESSKAVLDRIRRAWREMNRCASDLPEVYQVKGERSPIIQKAFPPLINALNGADPIA